MKVKRAVTILISLNNFCSIICKCINNFKNGAETALSKVLFGTNLKSNLSTKKHHIQCPIYTFLVQNLMHILFGKLFVNKGYYFSLITLLFFKPFYRIALQRIFVEQEQREHFNNSDEWCSNLIIAKADPCLR